MSKIYIDCGAHVGRTVKMALERDYDVVYAFEPNPAALAHPHWESIITDPRLRLIDSAVWVEDGHIKIYREPKVHYESFGDSQGATIMEGKESGGISYEKGWTKVSTIDFAEWLLEHVTAGDDVTLKMDIEGAEYVVLPACMNRDALELVSAIFIEFHGHKMTSVAGWRDVEQLFRSYCKQHKIELEEATH